MIVWLAALLPAVLAPVFEPRPGLFPHSDKVMHFLGWLGLGGLAGLLERRPRFAALAFGFGVMLGAATELLQLDIPGRDGDLWDFLADTAGALVGSLAASMLIDRSAPGPQ